MIEKKKYFVCEEEDQKKAPYKKREHKKRLGT